MDDPIIRLRAQLTREGKLTNEQFDTMDRKAKETALPSVKFAEESPGAAARETLRLHIRFRSARCERNHLSPGVERSAG